MKKLVIILAVLALAVPVWATDISELYPEEYNSIDDLPTAAPSDGDTDHVSLADQIYEFCETTQNYLPTADNDDSADDVSDDNVESMATAGGAGTVPESDGAGNLVMTANATQAELDALTASDVGAESDDSNDFDPDRLNGDTADNDLVDTAIVQNLSGTNTGDQDVHTVALVTVNAATYNVTNSSDELIVHVTYTDTGAVTSLTIDSDVISVSGAMLHVKDADGNAATNNITIDTEGSETIDGASSYTIQADHGAISLYSDGFNLYIH